MSFTRHFRTRTLAVLALLASVGCRFPLVVNHPPGVDPHCEGGVCLEIVWMRTDTDTIGLWVETPARTMLLNARVSDAGGPACQGGFPIEWVTVDADLRRSGPADIGGTHGVIVRVPFDTWARYWAETFLDVELSVAGTVRCVRQRLTLPDGALAVTP